MIYVASKIQGAPSIMVHFSRGRRKIVLDIGEDRLTCHTVQIPGNFTVSL